MSEATTTGSPVPDYYAKTFQGVLLDPARIARAYGVNDPMIFTALKKVLRYGDSVKTQKQDVIEARDALNRWLDMLAEDEQA